MPLLPGECWMRIVDFLPIQDLLSVSRVSNNLHDLAQPLIYRTISWSWDTIPTQRIFRLLRTTLKNPQLTAHIQHVAMLTSPEVKEDDDPWKPLPQDMNWDKESGGFADVVQYAQTVANQAKFPHLEKWSQALQDGDPYALVAILLSQLHNIRSLRLDYSFILSGFPGLMLKHALFSDSECMLSNFDSLVTVDYGSNVRIAEYMKEISDIDYVDGYPPCDPDQFMAWFYLPSVKSLAIWLRSMKGVTDLEERSNLDQLKTLLIARASVKESDLLSLLEETTVLQTLHLGMAYRWGDEVALYDSDEILEGLKCVSSTLEKLSLGVEYYPFTLWEYSISQELDESTRDDFWGFLKQFPKLQSVEVPITMLLNFSADNAPEVASLLPSAVRELCLQWDFCRISGAGWRSERELFEVVRYILAGLGTYTPHLKRITIRLLFWIRSLEEEHGLCFEERVGLQAECARTGVELVIVFDELSPGLWTQEDHLFY